MTPQEASEIVKTAVQEQFDKQGFVKREDIQKIVSDFLATQVKVQTPGRSDKEEKELAGIWLKHFLRGEVDKARKFKEQYPELWANQPEVKVTGITEATEAELVPTILMSSILAKLEQYARHRQICQVIPVGSQLGSWPAESATQITAYRTAAVTAPTEAVPTFTSLSWSTYRLAARLYLANALIKSSPTNLTNYLANRMAQKFALREWYELAVGTGSSMWKGINQETLSHAISDTTLSYKSLNNLFYSLPEAYIGLPSVAWMMTRAMEGRVSGITDTMGRPILSEPTRGIRTLFGAPVYNNSNILSATSKDEIYFGAWEYYGIFDLMALALVVENRGDTLVTGDMTLVYGNANNDGKCLLTDAFTKMTDILGE